MTINCLENIFSKENIISYSNVCMDLAIELPESKNLKKSRKFDTLVIPSRGAFPFFLGMVYSLDKLSSFGGDQKDFYENLGAPEMISSLLPENLEFKRKTNKKNIRTLLIPFTADLNMPKFDPNLDNDEFIFKTRRYWAGVTSSFFKDKWERKKNPYFSSFVDIVLKDIEGREELAEKYENFEKINSFSIIDTVISGRASYHILSSFEELAKKKKNPSLNPSAFLIIDEMGKKLKPKYSQYLYHKRLDGFIDFYKIPRIVSEDEGASLLGVGAVIYPSVMRASRNFEIDGEEFFIGAGGWHKCSDFKGNYFENFKSFMNMIYKGIDLIYKREYLGKENRTEQNKFEKSRESFLERAEKTKILAETCGDISILNPNNSYSYNQCYETGSHVLHAPFTDFSEKKVISRINFLPNIKYINNKSPKNITY